MTLTLDISDAVFSGLGIGREEIQNEARKELALAFYARGFVSLGKAVELAGTTRIVFEGWLRERKIERPYTVDDLSDDLEWSRL